MDLLNNINVVVSIIASCIAIGAAIRSIIVWYYKVRSSTPSSPLIIDSPPSNVSTPVVTRSMSPQQKAPSSSTSSPLSIQSYSYVSLRRRFVSVLGTIIGIFLEIVGCQLFFSDEFRCYRQDNSLPHYLSRDHGLLGLVVLFFGLFAFTIALFLLPGSLARRSITFLETFVGYVISLTGIGFYECSFEAKVRVLLGISFMLFAFVSAQLSPISSINQLNKSFVSKVAGTTRFIAVIGSVIGGGIVFYALCQILTQVDLLDISSYSDEISLIFIVVGFAGEIFGGVLFLGMLLLLTTNAPRRRKVACLETLVSLLLANCLLAFYGRVYIMTEVLIFIGTVIIVLTIFVARYSSVESRKLLFYIEIALGVILVALAILFPDFYYIASFIYNLPSHIEITPISFQAPGFSLALIVPSGILLILAHITAQSNWFD